VDTPHMYFAINHLDCAGGVVVTASHNPPQYNGFKVSKRQAKPVGEATGLAEVRKQAAMVDRTLIGAKTDGRVEKRDFWDAYKKHVLKHCDLGGKSLKIVIDASNGMAGTMVPKVFGETGGEVEGLTIVPLNFDNSKGEFVHEPNPLVASNLAQLQDSVRSEKADFGVCYDGDADRCVIVDETGEIVGCDHLTAALVPYFLGDRPGSSVVYDLRSTKAVPEEIERAGGKPIRSRVGHVFMKQEMATHRCAFGGELSGHFYFRSNFNADSGAIAMATVLSAVAASGKPVSSMIAPVKRYVQAGAVNFEIEDTDQALAEIREHYIGRGTIDDLDGVTVDCFETEGWWANIRKSNTEPLLRLNCEARDAELLAKVTEEISPLLGEKVAH
jgi:phosphomannomutase